MLALVSLLHNPETQMIAKAVEAAAPSRERDAWYERKAHWEGTARRRQEARAAVAATAAAAAPSHSVVHAQGAAAGIFGRTGVARWFGGTDAREEGGRRNRGRREEEGRGRRDEDEDDDDGFRLDKMQTVLAVAVMLVMAVIKMRGLR